VPRDLPRGQTTDQHARRQRRGNDEDDHCPIQHKWHREVGVDSREQPRQSGVTDRRDGDGGSSGDRGERDALGQHLLDDPWSTCAERQAQPHLCGARPAPRQQQAGQVCAGHDEQHADGQQQYGE